MGKDELTRQAGYDANGIRLGTETRTHTLEDAVKALRDGTPQDVKPAQYDDATWAKACQLDWERRGNTGPVPGLDQIGLRGNKTGV